MNRLERHLVFLQRQITPRLGIATARWVHKSTGEPVRYDDSSKHFRFTGTRATCQLGAQVEVPSVGFWWKSDPLNMSKARRRHIERIDRKSTRLNSSHVAISYAVFCLKKKKNIYLPILP